MRIRVTSIVAVLAVCLLARGLAAQDGPLADFNAVDAEWTEINDQIEKLNEMLFRLKYGDIPLEL